MELLLSITSYHLSTHNIWCKGAKTHNEIILNHNIVHNLLTTNGCDLSLCKGSNLRYIYAHVLCDACICMVPVSSWRHTSNEVTCPNYYLGPLAFDMEYARWLGEHQRQINDLRSALNSHLGDDDLRLLVDAIMSHYDEVFRLKIIATKCDMLHMLSGMWTTPVERCFMWLGGFRSSELLKVSEYLYENQIFL